MEQYNQFLQAIKSEDEALAIELLKLPEVLEHVIDRENYAFRLAAGKNLKNIFASLLQIHNVISDIAACNNYVLKMIISNGCLQSLNLLLEIPEVIENIIFDNLYMLKISAQDGRVDLINALFTSQLIKDKIADYHNHALRLASEYGHLPVVKKLAAEPAVKESISGVVGALKAAYKNDHSIVVYELSKLLAKQDFKRMKNIWRNRLVRTIIRVKEDKVALALFYKDLYYPSQNKSVTAPIYSLPTELWVKIAEYNHGEIDASCPKRLWPLYMFAADKDQALLMDEAIESVYRIRPRV